MSKTRLPEERGTTERSTPAPGGFGRSIGLPGWVREMPFRRRIALTLDYAVAELQHQFLSESEQRRTFLWFPVIFAAGILIYFQLPREPMLPALALTATLAGAIVFYARIKEKPSRLGVFIVLIALGALTANIRVQSLVSATIEEPVYASVHGTVVSVQVRADRPARVVLENPVIESRKPVPAPARIRITLRKDAGLPPIGGQIGLRARLGPVPGPAVPGGYDPRRAAFFEGIGASGFALGHWSVRTAETGAGQGAGLAAWIGSVRHALVRRIRENQPGPAGAVAAALLVGERGYLSTDTVQNLRDAGLAHILAISGLHMALFAGSVFFAVRALLALSETLALTRPIKKWAALAALLAGLFYLVLSGGSVSTLRAFIMASIMFGAVLVDRPALSLRNLAIAALIILSVEPESVVEPGFLMSFAAVTALIAFYEAWRERSRLNLAEPPKTMVGRSFRSIRIYVGTIAMTTIIAGFATGPIAAFYFNHAAVYSLIGNLLAMPVVALVVMPFGLLSLLLMPVGLEGLPLAVMALGTTAIMDIAEMVSRQPGATLIVPSVQPMLLLVYMAGFLWLCLWRRSWRWLGLLPVGAAALAVPLARQAPDVLISATGTMVAVRDDEGSLGISARRPNQFVLEQWFRREGRPLPDRGRLSQGVRCDQSACLLDLPGGRTLAHIRHISAFSEECREASVIVTPLVAPDDCQSPLIIDKPRLARFGAHMILAGESGNFRLKTAYPVVRRPWHEPASAR